MTVDTLEYVKRLEAAGVPRAQAEAHATALRDEIAAHLVTNVDLGAAVDRLEGKIESEVARLEGKIETQVARLDGKIAALDAKVDALEVKMDNRFDAQTQRIESMIWKAAFAVLGGSLAIGGLSIRFVR